MKKKSEHYVDNKQFLQAMIEYKKSCVLAESKNEQKPPVSNYIGECFLKIANHLSYRPNFINYTYKEEMILTTTNYLDLKLVLLAFSLFSFDYFLASSFTA